ARKKRLGVGPGVLITEDAGVGQPLGLLGNLTIDDQRQVVLRDARFVSRNQNGSVSKHLPGRGLAAESPQLKIRVGCHLNRAVRGWNKTGILKPCWRASQ